MAGFHDDTKSTEINGLARTTQLTDRQREMLSELIDFIKDFVAHQMRRKKHFSHEDVKSLLGDYLSSNSEASTVLRYVANKLEDDNEALFSQMCVRLQITQATVYGTFVGVVRELFESGVNWGRIVALIAFCEALVVHCARTGMREKAKHVIVWTALYMMNNLSEWMRDNGGWDGFQRHFQRQTSYSSLLLTAAGIVGIGLAIAMSCR